MFVSLFNLFLAMLQYSEVLPLLDTLKEKGKDISHYHVVISLILTEHLTLC